MVHVIKSHGVTVVEYPAAGATYSHDEYGVYEYDEYPDGSVLAGQPRRTSLGAFATLAEARAAHPGAGWHGAGSGYVDRPIPAGPPEWFDPDAAGEVWSDD
jgi:hypothetical protein